VLLTKMRGRIRELYHCSVQGHGASQMDGDHKHVCELMAEKDVLTRTQEKRMWRSLEKGDSCQ